MWNFGRFLNARSTKIHSTVGCKNVLRVKIKVIQSKASKHFIAVVSSMILYMSFDKLFLAVVESRDLSQADKILIRVSSFPTSNINPK